MDGPPPQEEDFSTIPIQDRLAHKNWKARVSAYESLVKTFQNTASDTDPAFRPYISNPDLLKKIAADPNAVAQEKGVEVLAALVKFAGETAAKTRDAVVPVLVDKTFGSTRAGTKNHAIELVLQYVEVENGAAGVVGDILPGLSAKQPKVVAGCVTALKEIVRLFGTQAVPSPPILKSLAKIFSHTDKTVRAEGTLLTCTLYQYIGSAIDPWLAELKPVQVKELHEIFEKLENEDQGRGKLKPERLTRAQARDVETHGAGIEPDAEQEDHTPLDPRTFAELVDIVSKLPSGLQANLASSKWKERKEALDDLAALLTSTPRIMDAPELNDVIKCLAGRMGDANINCVIVAAACVEAFAKGMAGSFAKYREMVVPPMLERLKERKQNVTDAIGLGLDAVFTTTSMPDILGDIMPVLSSKNPQVKEGALKFLARCLSTTTAPPSPPQVKPLSEALGALLEDSFEGARNEAATCLGILMKIVGERPLNALMDGLADVRKVKVKEAFDKATVKCKAGAGGPAKPAAVPVAPPTKKKGPVLAKKEVKSPESSSADAAVDPGPSAVAKPAVKLPARLMEKKAPIAPAPAKKSVPAAAAAAVGKPSKAPASASPNTLDAFKYKHNPEDSEALAADLIPTAIMADLSDANWKTRLAALEEMTTWIQSVIEDIDSEVVVRFLGKKGWGEKNFQVSAKLYGILTMLAEQCPTFGRSSAALSVPHLIDKLGDVKLKKPAGETLLAFAEKTSLSFVLTQAYDPLSKQKAPKVLADALMWIDSAVTEFGIAGLSLRNLIEFLKAALANSNAAVRTSATKTLVTVKLFAGPGIKDLLGDLNPQLLTTIQSEFDKVEDKPAPEPTRTSADLANAVASSGPGKAAAIANPMDDLFPRVEIDVLLKGTTVLADAKNDAWKTKKEALEALQAILDQGPNKRLKPTMGEIGQVLKARVTDTNQAVKLLALDIISRIAIGMGKPFEKQTRFFVLPVATVLSDQKAPIRVAATHTLSAIATACEGVDSMVHNLTTALESSNPLQRSSLLNWIAEWFKEHEPGPSVDLSPWAAPIVTCLDDRAADIRKGAQAVLPFVIARAGLDYVMQQSNSLKPAARSTAVAAIQAAARSAPVAAGPPPPTKPTAPSNPKVVSTVAAIPAPATDSPPPASPPLDALATKIAPPSKLTGVRRKLPLGTTSRPESRSDTAEEQVASRLPSKAGSALKRPTSGTAVASKVPSAGSPAPSATAVFVTVSSEPKRARGAKDSNKWINEAGPTRKDLAELLQHQMEPHTSKDTLPLLFSNGHNAINDRIAGLSILCELYSHAAAGDDKHGFSGEDCKSACIANVDLPLKYASITIHEPQPNLISKCLDTVDTVLAFLRTVNYQITEPEAMCFIPTIIYKLGDAREAVRVRVQQIIQTLPTVYAYSRIVQLLLDHGLRSKVAKTRQGALDELGSILKRSGMGACEPHKAFPVIASLIADKDAQVRKSALSTISEAYVLVGEKVWSFVGPLSPKDKTQLEERLRRVAGPSSPDKVDSPPPVQAGRFLSGIGRPASPATVSARTGGVPRPGSPNVAGPSRMVPQNSPPGKTRPASPGQSNIGRPASPARVSRIPGAGITSLGVPSSPVGGARPKSFLPSRLGPPRPRPNIGKPSFNSTPALEQQSEENRYPHRPANGNDEATHHRASSQTDFEEPNHSPAGDGMTLTISTILSSDSARSVEALKKIQKILDISPEDGPSSPAYQDLAEHTEGLIETVTLQLGHVFDRPDDIAEPENFRLAKHLIQTLNAFCDHGYLAESMTVDILQALLEELTMRLLQTDESSDPKVKDLSRFINMIILRLFATARRMAVFRALFNLLLQIVKPFPTTGAQADSKEAKIAELVLKCLWKLARNIPVDLEKQQLDPVELFPAIEYFLQSVPPNEWRARATNKVPCGDMPLRTVKVIIQHVVAHYGEEVYDFLSGSFDDPSATIVYPYVYRILNSSTRVNADALTRTNGSVRDQVTRHSSPGSSSRPLSPQASQSPLSVDRRNSSPSHRTSHSSVNGGGAFGTVVEEPDPDVQLMTIIGHISSETTGAMHKEGVTELHQFLKAYPHKKPKVDKMLDSTGPAFRKYIARALASRAAEDEERDAVVADTLSKLESNRRDPLPTSPAAARTSSLSSPPHSPARTSFSEGLAGTHEKLTRLHDLFQYRSSTLSNGSAYGRGVAGTGSAGA